MVGLEQHFQRRRLKQQAKAAELAVIGVHIAPTR
jgi:hypothetical protein